MHRHLCAPFCLVPFLVSLFFFIFKPCLRPVPPLGQIEDFAGAYERLDLNIVLDSIPAGGGGGGGWSGGGSGDSGGSGPVEEVQVRILSLDAPGPASASAGPAAAAAAAPSDLGPLVLRVALAPRQPTPGPWRSSGGAKMQARASAAALVAERGAAAAVAGLAGCVWCRCSSPWA